MNLTARQISLIQGTFRKLGPIARTFAELFFTRLFALEPGLRPLFQEGDENREARANRLIRVMHTLVSNLDKQDRLKQSVAALGRSALGRALLPPVYDAAGQALIWTLARGLEDEFTDEAKLAWLDAYMLLAELMEASMNRTLCITAGSPAA